MRGDTLGREPSGSSPLQVLAWPAYQEDDLNPYIGIVYGAFESPAATVIPFKPLSPTTAPVDVFHIHWPEGIFWGKAGKVLPLAVANAMAVLRTARRVRRGGGLVAMTLHNLAPHEAMTPTRRLLWRVYYRALLRQTGFVIAMSQASLDVWRAANPAAVDIQAEIVPHPHYRDHYPTPPSRAAARSQLGLDETARVIGIVGAIRASKRVPQAVATFLAVAGEAERLVVAGDCKDSALWREIETAAAGDPRVRLSNARLSDEQLVATLAACDICLINQEGTLNSATVLLGLSQNRPVIAPDVGSLPEIAAMVGPQWLALTPTPLTAEGLRAAIDRLTQGGRAERAPIDAFDPEAVSQATLNRLSQAWATRHR